MDNGENKKSFSATTVTALFDWFDKKENHSKVIFLLIVIIAFLGYNYYHNEQERAVRLGQLEANVKACAEIKQELEAAKMNAILLQASTDYAPNAQWLTAAGSNIVLWVNKAYERKYLTPKGYSIKDIVGTDASHIFGESMADKFKASNDLVLKLHRPVVVQELVKTLKFEVKLGSYTYAVGGMEYEDF